MKPPLKHRLARRLLELGQRLHVDVLPRHFYSQIPDLRQLERTRGWRRPHDMSSVRGAGLGEQAEFVREMTADGLGAAVDRMRPWESACEANGEVGYGPLEGQFLFCLAARLRPQRVIQVGAGVSTAILLHARATHGIENEIVCVDPHPTPYLQSLAERGEVALVAEPAEEIELSTLTALEPGSLLFVDSTHAVRPGGEVSRIVLDALPRLRPGVMVHFHDIFFPYDYSPQVLSEDVFFHGETSLLHAFLSGNCEYSIRASLSMLHNEAPRDLAAALPGYRPASADRGIALERLDADRHWPSALYIERIGEGS